MKKIGKWIAAGVTAGVLAGVLAVTSFAATSRKAISTVSLTFDMELYPGASVDADVVEIGIKSNNYYLDSAEFLNDGFNWSLTDVPEMKITLRATDGYYFTMKSSKDVKLSGYGATYVKASKLDNWETVELTIKFNPLSETIGPVDSASWTSTGLAGWSEAVGAGGYEVRLLRNGGAVGTSKVVSGVSYDFSSIMTKAANYTFQVRAVNAVKSEIKSSWVESNSFYVDDNQASLFRNGATAQGWKQDNVGWWYQNADQSYTVNNWQLISDKWYFFDGTGYMKTGWIEWNGKSYYCTENGDMLSNTTTPDGHAVDMSGARLN